MPCQSLAGSVPLKIVLNPRPGARIPDRLLATKKMVPRSSATSVLNARELVEGQGRLLNSRDRASFACLPLLGGELNLAVLAHLRGDRERGVGGRPGCRSGWPADRRAPGRGGFPQRDGHGPDRAVGQLDRTSAPVARPCCGTSRRKMYWFGLAGLSTSSVAVLLVLGVVVGGVTPCQMPVAADRDPGQAAERDPCTARPGRSAAPHTSARSPSQGRWGSPWRIGSPLAVFRPLRANMLEAGRSNCRVPADIEPGPAVRAARSAASSSPPTPPPWRMLLTWLTWAMMNRYSTLARTSCGRHVHRPARRGAPTARS